MHTAVGAYSRPATFVGWRIAVSLMHEKSLCNPPDIAMYAYYLLYLRSRFRRSNPRDIIYPRVSIATKITLNTQCNYRPRVLITSEKDDVRAEVKLNRKMRSKMMSLLEEEVLDKLNKR